VTPRAPSDSGQASLEVLALLPVLLGIALAAVYLAGMLAAAGQAQDRARALALAATGESGAVVAVVGSARWPGAPLPGLDRGASRVHASVRVP
jgi:uncharacterized protein (UPF0333 family)